MAHQFYCAYVTVKYYCSCAGSPSPLEPTAAAKKRKKYDSETTMSNKRKATSSKIQSTSVTPACKNNWIFTATLDSDAVEKLCLTIFDINRNLNTEVFEYAIVGTNPSSNRKKGGDWYDIFGYVQIKKHRWSRRELLRHFGVTVTTYSSTECVFGNLEGKWKPNSVVEHIKMVCPTHITEGGKLRKRGSKPNTKKEDCSDSTDDDDNNVEEDVEEDKEEEVEPVARRAVVARPNPFIARSIPSEAPTLAPSSISQHPNVKPAVTIVSSRSSSSNMNSLANGRRNFEPTVLPHSNVAVSSRAVVAADAGGRKEVQFRSPFPGLKSDLCKHLEKHLLSKMDSRFNVYFAELEKRGEEHLKIMLSQVYKAITDFFGSQVAVENQDDQEELDPSPEIEIGNEDEGNERSPN